MKSKAVERLASVTLSTDDSEDSEPELIDTKELDMNSENTGLRRRDVGDPADVKSDASIFKRSISRMEEMDNYDEDDVDDDVQIDKDDEEEVETGSVRDNIYNY